MAIEVPFKKTLGSTNKRIIPSSFKKAIISKVNASSFSADIIFPTNLQTIIKNVPFSTSVNISKVNPGDRCRVDVFDETNSSDMVVAYTYGSGNQFPVFSTGAATVSSAGNSIAHGLIGFPRWVGITKEFGDTIAVYEYKPADNVNIYLKASSSSTQINWIAIIF